DVDQDDMQRGPVAINVWPQQLLGRELIDLCPRQDVLALQQRAARCIALEQRAADIREDGRVPPAELRYSRAELARVLPRWFLAHGIAGHLDRLVVVESVISVTDPGPLAEV